MSYDEATGEMRYPRHDEPVPESALGGYLDEARAVFAAAETQSAMCDEQVRDGAVSPDFEHLRWFELPSVCLGASSG